MNDDRSLDQLTRSLDHVEAPSPDLQGVQRRARALKTRRTLTTGVLSLLILAAIAIPLGALVPLSSDTQPADPSVALPELGPTQFMYREIKNTYQSIGCRQADGDWEQAWARTLRKSWTSSDYVVTSRTLRSTAWPAHACGEKNTKPQLGNDMFDGLDTLSKLPTDPAALGSLIRQQARPGVTAGTPLSPPFTYDETRHMWIQIEDWLTSGPLTPRLEAAMMQVAADLPRGEVQENQLDPVGRAARVISYSSGGPITRYFVDPDTWLLLASTERRLDNGAVNWIDIILSENIVDSVGELPAQSLIPAPVTNGLGPVPRESGDQIPPSPAPPSPEVPSPQAVEEAAIYAAVITQSGPHFAPNYISDTYECDDTSRTARCTPIPGDVQRALLAALGADFSFVSAEKKLRDMLRDMRDNILEGEGGTLHTLSTIEGEAPRVTVRALCRFGACGAWGWSARYVVKLREGDWSVTGTVGAVLYP